MKFQAFDTETIHGKAFLIASPDYYRDVSTFDECIDFLFGLGRSRLFAYNMDYDAGAILKHLPSREVDKIYLHNEILVNKTKVIYLPAKVFRLVRKGKEIEIFDLMQFYNSSLEIAAQKILGEGKDDIPLFVKENLGEYYPLPEWKEKIRFYCIRDAHLTQRLGNHFLNMLETAGVNASKFYSTGYLAGRYLSRAGVGKIPSAINDFVQPSYHGGRNECCLRGFVKDCYVYDVKSAYPAMIRKLKTLQGATYHMLPKVDRKASYHVIQAKIVLRPGRHIYPIPWKDKKHSFIFYPRLTGQSVTITGPEYDTLLKHDLIESIKGMKVLNVYTRDTLAFPFVDKLFEERQKSEAHSYIFKLILNSLYGKFYEKRYKYRKMDGREQYRYDKASAYELEFRKYQEYAMTKCKNAFLYYEKSCGCPVCTSLWRLSCILRWKRKKEIIPVIVRDDKGNTEYYRKSERAGKNFNILFATYITAGLRSQIYEAAVSAGSDFVACFTDSVFTRSPLSPEHVGSGIGGLELKGMANNLVMIGTGVYEHDSEDGQYTRFRGFKRSGALRELLADVGDSGGLSVETDTLQRITWGTIVQQTKTWFPEDFNRLVQRTKKLHINFDHKRIWESPFYSSNDALTRCISSQPLEL